MKLSRLSAFVVLVFAANVAGTQVWVAEGPGPSLNGQVEGLAGGEVVGAIQAIAAHPTNASVLFAGGVNGGIWKTLNATAASPNWMFQTDGHPSLSISVIEFDPIDVNHLTLVAGVGRTSSFGRIGGSLTGLLRTVDGGGTWSVIDGGMAGRNISGVAPRGSVVVASVDTSDSNNIGTDMGVFRSTDTGATWTQISGGPATGLPDGRVDALASFPGSPATLMASVVSSSVANGIYLSSDTAATWFKVSDAAMDALLFSSSATNVKISVGSGNNIFVAIAPGNTGRLGGVFHSASLGSTWTAMDIPGDGFFGIHPGGQASIHLSLVADPGNGNIVYIGGDRQDFPNAIGAGDYSGRLFRGDASANPGSQWVHLTHNSALGAAGGGTASNSAPHADSRDMAFDADGNLIESDDGGIYKRTLPMSDTGDWFSINGDIQTTELHDTAWDPVSGILIGGAQDTGTPEQLVIGGTTWNSVSTADGGDVAVDAISSPSFSYRYSSFQNLQVFRRRQYDSSNSFISQVFPTLTVIGGGAPFSAQFTTPVVVNKVTGTRLIIGGYNSVYESLDQGTTITELQPSGIRARSGGRNAISYGAVGNADVLYVGGCSGACATTADYGVFIRTVGGGTLVKNAAYAAIVPTPGQVQGIAGDPDTPGRAFVIDSNAVYQTDNMGASWSTVTGDLTTFVPGTLRAVAYLNKANGDAVVVGADRGVFIATEANGFAAWAPFGNGLPNAPVYELDYDAGGDVLVAGTMGRGAFSMTSTLGIFTDGFESGNTTAWSSWAP